MKKHTQKIEVEIENGKTKIYEYTLGKNGYQLLLESVYLGTIVHKDVENRSEKEYADLLGWLLVMGIEEKLIDKKMIDFGGNKSLNISDLFKKKISDIWSKMCEE